jgi:hypothetical protein
MSLSQVAGREKTGGPFRVLSCEIFPLFAATAAAAVVILLLGELSSTCIVPLPPPLFFLD